MSVTTKNFPFIVNHCYSLGYWLKDYGNYSKNLPLCTYMDHGMTLFDKIPEHELVNDAPLIFKFSPRSVETYKKQSGKPVYNIINPAIYFRISHNIEKSPTARGSLFFVGHSTRDIDDHTDWDDFVKSFQLIPENFYPIDICLHPADLEKGLDIYFREKGFNVISAGPAYSDDFIAKFYDNLRHYQFVLSNLIGSYTFYSVEMNIPFSLFGEEPKYFNKGDANIENGHYNSYKEQPTYQKARTLFGGFHETVSAEQKDFVEFETGKKTTISRKEAHNLLYKALILYMAKHPKNLRYIKTAIRMQINERYKIGYRMIRNFYHKIKAPVESSKPLLKMSSWERTTIRYLSDQGIKSTVLAGHKIRFMQPHWFLHNYDEIFKQHVYYFESDNKKPLIIDCGSNIGLSIIYFKMLFPESNIIAFEPDPTIFELLNENLVSFRFSSVDLNNSAIWKESTTLSFKKGYLDGHIVEDHVQDNNFISVKSYRLRDLLEKYDKIDFLKIDIEGAELDVLEDCAGYLTKVDNLFIEFHNKGGKYLKDLHKLLSILEQNGFRYHMKEAYNFESYPFSNRAKRQFDEIYNSLNVFAFRNTFEKAV
jgi:FkbM family methyltransferase